MDTKQVLAHLRNVKRENLETIVLYLFAFFSMLSIGLSTVFIWILTFIVILDKKRWKGFYKRPMFWLFLVSFLYLVGSTIHGCILFPEEKKLQLDDATRWLRLWLFLSVGTTINGDEQKALNILKLALIGFLLSIIIYIVKHPNILITMSRSGFGHKIIAYALYSSTAIIGIIIFFPRTFHLKKFKFFLACIWFIVIILLTQTLIITRSRGVWLAILIVLPITVFFYYFKKNKKYLKWNIGIVIVLIIIFIINFNKIIKHRLMVEYPTLKFIIEKKENFIISNSIGVRYFLFKLGIKKFFEKPILGWGTGSTIPLIKESKNKKLQVIIKNKIKWRDHFHNFYIEICVRFGLIGMILIGSTISFLLIKLYRIKNIISYDIYLFLISILGLISIYSLSDFRHLHPDFRFYWALIGGVTYGLSIRHDNKRHPT